MAAYVIAMIEVTDPEGYPAYASRTVASATPYGGEFLAKGGPQTVVEGSAKPRTVIIRFPDRAAAEAWLISPEYLEIKPIGQASSTRDMLIVDGV